MPNLSDYSFEQWSHPDTDYISARDALIPEAEKIAKQRVQEIGKDSDWRTGVEGKKFKWDYFSEEFHKEMNRLWAETIASSTLKENVGTASISTASESGSIQKIKANSGFTFAE